MVKNTFCYVEKKDIELNLKASEENSNCVGCMYLSFCEKDVGLDKKGKKESVRNDKEKDKDKETIKKSKGKTKSAKGKKSVGKRKTKKKKSLEELAEEDIF